MFFFGRSLVGKLENITGRNSYKHVGIPGPVLLAPEQFTPIYYNNVVQVWKII